MFGETERALKPWQSWALRLAATAALLTGIFWFIPISEVIRVLGQARPGYLLIGVAVMLASSYVQAVSLWLLIRRLGLRHGPTEVFEINMITRFYGQFLPSEVMAGAVKLYRLAGPEKNWGEVLAALGFFRFMNLLVLLLLGVVFWWIDMPTGPGRWVGLLIAVMGLVLVAAHVMLTSPAVSRFLQRIVPDRGFRWLQGRIVEKGKRLVEVTVRSYRLFKDMLLTIGFLAVIRHALGILSFALFALSVDVHLSFLTIGWIRVVLQAVLMLPISVSGLGLREGSLAILLQEYGVSSSQAVAVAFLLFAAGLLVNALGGIFELKNVLRPDGDEATIPGRAE